MNIIIRQMNILVFPMDNTVILILFPLFACIFLIRCINYIYFKIID